MFGSLRHIYSTDSAALEEKRLSYCSDFFSFVGNDPSDCTAFMLECNRGQNRTTWQAEQHAAVYTRSEGLGMLPGGGRYPNPYGLLGQIPPSEWILCDKDHQNRLNISSEKHRIFLESDQLQTAGRLSKGLATFELEMGPAVLTWQGLQIPGRIQHHQMCVPAFNPTHPSLPFRVSQFPMFTHHFQ